MINGNALDAPQEVDDLGGSFSLGCRDRLSIDVHCHLNLGMAQQLLLHRGCCAERMKKRRAHVPERVPDNIPDSDFACGRFDVISEQNIRPPHFARIAGEDKIRYGRIAGLPLVI